MKPLALAAALSLLACAAQARTAGPVLVTRWDTPTITNAAQALDAKDVVAKLDDDGRAYITGETAEGLLFVLYPTACEETAGDKAAAQSPCYGLEAVVSYEGDGKQDRSKLVDQLNRDYALGKFTLDPDHSIVLTRYLIFDDGVTRGNLEAELSSFFAVGASAAGKIWPNADKAGN